QLPLEALWVLNSLGELDAQTVAMALQHKEPAVRIWAIRLLGDVKDKEMPSIPFNRMLSMPARERDPQVRSQLASTAKRLPAAQATLLKSAPQEAERAIGLAGVKEGFAGLPLGSLSPQLADVLKSSGDPEIALRLGDAAAFDKAIKFVEDESKDPQQRVRYIDLLGQLGK